MADTPEVFALRGARIYVSGHRGMVGSACVRRLEAAGAQVLTADRASGGPAPPGPGRSLHGRGEAGRRGGRRRAGRRHPRQRHAAGRIPLRQPDDRGEPDRGGASGRREPAAVPRLLLHLSEGGGEPDHRGCAADRPARADQPVVRHRQDRRHQALPGLSPAIRARLHLGHAVQPVWPRRLLPPRAQPRHPRAAAALPRRGA